MQVLRHLDSFLDFSLFCAYGAKLQFGPYAGNDSRNDLDNILCDGSVFMCGTGNLVELPPKALIRSVKGRQSMLGVVFMIRFLRSADIFSPLFSQSFVSTAHSASYNMIWTR